MIRALPKRVQDANMVLFHIVYKIVQSYQLMTNLNGDSQLITLNGGTIVQRFLCEYCPLFLLPSAIPQMVVFYYPKYQLNHHVQLFHYLLTLILSRTYHAQECIGDIATCLNCIMCVIQ